MPKKDSIWMRKFIGYNFFLDVSPSVRIQSENNVLLSSFKPNNKAFFPDSTIRLIQFLYNFPRSQSFFEELKEVNSLKIAELERTIQEYESELKRLNEILQKWTSINLQTLFTLFLNIDLNLSNQTVLDERNNLNLANIQLRKHVNELNEQNEK